MKTPRSIPRILNYAIIFMVIALIAGAFGFGFISGTAATIAKVTCLVFLALCTAALVRSYRKT